MNQQNPSQLSPDIVNTLFDQLLQDQEIGDALLSKIDWSQAFNDEETQQWAQSILGEDADLVNLTRDEKIQLFKASEED